MTNRDPVEIDASSGKIETLPPERGRRYRCKLDTLADVKAEMARVYRECRSELIDPASGSKLVYMLQAVAKVIETSDLEQRVSALESKP